MYTVTITHKHTHVHTYIYIHVSTQALCGSTVDVPTLDDRIVTVAITESIKFVCLFLYFTSTHTHTQTHTSHLSHFSPGTRKQPGTVNAR